MSPPPPAATERPPLGRVVAVDDDPGIRKFVSKVLRGYGYRVDVAASVDEALALLAGASYDVALVDLNMPVRSGLELIEAVVADANPVVPILLTGTTDVGAAVACMKRGAFDYLPKPIDPEALGWAVERALGVSLARVREIALTRIASEWEATFDACPDALLVLDTAGTVLRANRAAGHMTGAEPAHLIGREVTALFPDGFGAGIHALQQGTPCAGGPICGFDPARGTHLLATADPIRYGAWVVVVRDVTERVRGEEERKQLLRRTLSAQEDERQRIARELHDGIGQSLVSLAVGMAGIGAGAGPDQVPRLQRFAADALDEIRRIAHGLRPAVLDDMGLTPALERLTAVFTQVHGVRAEMLAPDGPVPRLPTEVESALYRIVQEALSNVAKHAHARTVDVVLETAPGWVQVSVTDDGTGFPAGAAGGMGLPSIRERAALLGGTCRIDSAVGRGTTLDVRIPVPEVALCLEPE